MHDGRKGICKNVDHCESIKQALRHGQLRLENIVRCSFMVNEIIFDSFLITFIWFITSFVLKGTVQIACCADETPQPNENQLPVMQPSTTDFVFM